MAQSYWLWKACVLALNISFTLAERMHEKGQLQACLLQATKPSALAEVTADVPHVQELRWRRWSSACTSIAILVGGLALLASVCARRTMAEPCHPSQRLREAHARIVLRSDTQDSRVVEAVTLVVVVVAATLLIREARGSPAQPIIRRVRSHRLPCGLTPNGITPFLCLFEGERQAVSKLGSSARSSVRAEALIAPVSYGATMRTMQSTLPVISGTSKQPPKRRLRAPFTVARFVSLSHGQSTV